MTDLDDPRILEIERTGYLDQESTNFSNEDLHISEDYQPIKKWRNEYGEYL